MHLPTRLTDLFIDAEPYCLCPLLPTQEFIRFCKKRKLQVDEDRLHKLERLGLFHPLLRIYRPDRAHKVEYVDGGTRYRDHGPLQKGEVWEGETRVEPARFGFRTSIVRSWREHGYVWDPRIGPSPNIPKVTVEDVRHIAYFSRFQIYDLNLLVSRLTQTVQVEWAVEDDGTLNDSWDTSLSGCLAKIVPDLMRHRDEPNCRQIAGLLCQFISDRYHPKTLSDEFRLTLRPDGISFPKWDWQTYVSRWSPASALEAFGLDRDELASLYRQLAGVQQHIDPLQHWHDLVRFVRLDQRERLKGDALKAMTMRQMADMLRLLHEDAFGERLEPPNEVGIEILHRVPNVTFEEDPLRAREYIMNMFGLNSRPRVVLFVEGKTEATIIPLIFDRLYRAKPGIHEIEIVNLGGVGNMTGDKENPFSALWRLIDYLHHHQTVAFVLMDNEGLAKNIAKGLPSASSLHFPNRFATRRNYVKIWKRSLEFDNFSDTEIANALSEYAGDTVFSRSDIAARRAAASPSKDGKKHTIERLYKERTGVRLDKPDFGRKLVDIMFNAGTKRSPDNRPLVCFLDRVAKVARRNHPLVTQTIWETNQRKGRLGRHKP